MVQFPTGFLWGAATAGHQIEGAACNGGRSESVWDVFSHTDGKVAHGHTGDVACGHHHRVDDDVAMMADLGLQSYRFSISWSRVMPDGRGRINQEGRLLPPPRRPTPRPRHRSVPTLFRWDLPQALEELGGFRNRDTVSWFGDYAALMVRELGDRVHMWSTFNEPWCYAYLGHASGVHAPGLTDPHAAVTVAHHELLAHGLALQTMRAERNDLQLGIVINPSNIVSDAQRPADDAQVRLIDAIHNRWWFDATLRNNYPADLLESYGRWPTPSGQVTPRRSASPSYDSATTTPACHRSTSPRTAAPTTTRSSTADAPTRVGSTTSTSTCERSDTPSTRASTFAATTSGR